MAVGFRFQKSFPYICSNILFFRVFSVFRGLIENCKLTTEYSDYTEILKDNSYPFTGSGRLLASRSRNPSLIFAVPSSFFRVVRVFRGLQKDPFNLCFRVVAEIDPESQFKTGCFQIVIDLNTVFSCSSFTALMSSSVYSVYSVV